MQITVLNEMAAGGETRVALVPESVKKLKALGISVSIESGAGIKPTPLTPVMRRRERLFKRSVPL